MIDQINFKVEKPDKTINELLERLEYIYGSEMVRACVWVYLKRKEKLRDGKIKRIS